MEQPAERRAWIESALYGCDVLSQIDWTGAAHPFTVSLVRQLDNYGECEPNQLALALLLEGLKQQVGADVKQQIDVLLGKLSKPKAFDVSLPPQQPSAHPAQPASPTESLSVYPEAIGRSGQSQPQSTLRVGLIATLVLIAFVAVLVIAILLSQGAPPIQTATSIPLTARTEVAEQPTDPAESITAPLPFDILALTRDALDQTATATLWTATLTPQLTASFEAFLRTRAASTSSDVQTATATQWTHTPTPTYTPTFTSTLTATETPIPPGITGNPVTSNEQWKPFIESNVRVVDGIEMVLVPAGCFEMGDDLAGIDGSLTAVPKAGQQCFAAPFWISRYEITNAEFNKVLHCGAAQESHWTGDNFPRESLTWDEADQCARKIGRLPTETEWEYAARGPDDLYYPWGNRLIAANVVYDWNSGGHTAEVGSSFRTGGQSWVGAYDMSGNVWEWTSSSSVNYPNSHVVRGGSWYYNSNYARAASRGSRPPEAQYSDIGFRIAADFSAVSGS